MAEPADVDHEPVERSIQSDTLLRALLPKVKRHVKDIIFCAVLVIVIIALVSTLMSKLTLKHDAAGARKISDQVIADIAKRDGADVRKLGTQKFQKTYSASALTTQFHSISSVTEGKPSLEGQKIIRAHSGTDTTAFMSYRYPPRIANTSYHIAVVLVEKNGHWQVTNLSGAADTSKLGN
ncbi:MAG TPA: hypothetical protein VLF59_00475 [Candidatus Saccharimonadales bacterium]|nr:hypothetical protein [Candidatus Saccharimonadales bacterium]